MGCNSCKDKRKTFSTGVPNTEIENKSVGVKIMVFIVKLILFLIASAILSIIIIPFGIYTLAKVFFYDGSVDVEGFIVGLKKWGEMRQDRRDDRRYEKEDAEDADNYEYEYADVDEIIE